MLNLFGRTLQGYKEKCVEFRTDSFAEGVIDNAGIGECDYAEETGQEKWKKFFEKGKHKNSFVIDFDAQPGAYELSHVIASLVRDR